MRQRGGAYPRWHAELTSRQLQVVALIARGSTNKEIAHRIGITERGVAALVSRMLRRFRVPNRAGLVATISRTIVSASAASDEPAATEGAPGPDLGAWDGSPLLVSVTIGKDHVVAYQNSASTRLLSGDDDPEPFVGPAHERFDSESIARMREIADEALTRGVPVTANDTPVQWRIDDGTWQTGLFSGVMQPLRGPDGRVEGILWIGTSRKSP